MVQRGIIRLPRMRAAPVTSSLLGRPLREDPRRLWDRTRRLWDPSVPQPAGPRHLVRPPLATSRAANAVRVRNSDSFALHPAAAVTAAGGTLITCTCGLQEMALETGFHTFKNTGSDDVCKVADPTYESCLDVPRIWMQRDTFAARRSTGVTAAVLYPASLVCARARNDMHDKHVLATLRLWEAPLKVIFDTLFC